MHIIQIFNNNLYIYIYIYILVWARTYSCAANAVGCFVYLMFLVSFNYCFLISNLILYLISLAGEAARLPGLACWHVQLAWLAGLLACWLAFWLSGLEAC